MGLLKSRWQRWLLLALPSLEEIAAVFAELLKNLVAFIPGAAKDPSKNNLNTLGFVHSLHAWMQTR
jgi:hypothetical protein